MKQDEAEKLARKVLPRKGAPNNQWCPRRADELRALCDHVLSGDMKREIENAAFERAAKVAEDRSKPLPIHTDMERGYTQARKNAAWAIRALITPEKTADTEE